MVSGSGLRNQHLGFFALDWFLCSSRELPYMVMPFITFTNPNPLTQNTR